MASIPIPRRYRSIVYIPSRTDGCQLEVCLSVPTTVSPTLPQAYTGVVIAHPYGPLGGSYNNNVVGALLQWFETYPLQATRNDDYIYPSSAPLAKKQNSTGNTSKSSLDLDPSSTSEEALSSSEANPKVKAKKSNTTQVSLACVICAFNFRGCGKSKGRTSWFGEAEREDYQTVIDFLQSGGSPPSSFHAGEEVPRQAPRVYDESGNEITPPRLPFLSRFVLSGFSYGGLIASTIPPPLRDPTVPDGPRLPTSYIFVSFPAGVAWFLTSGSHGSFAKHAKAILHDSESTAASTDYKPTIDAYFITGTQDQFTSPKTLLSWLKTNTGLNPPKPPVSKGQHNTPTSWAQTRPNTTVHVDIVDKVDHFWLDREQELLDRLQAWWTSIHPN
ncbi:hypothetical protein BG006_003505 [Podila minutissima]|uniref:Alpha/beta-hydrolase n=1 Tax=Podila minutissima TaxID=64525 RepID=A0A9P5SAQ4_9FUNG|nr:hypothetical protein BG006_003505 [Podila minutissima]